jgi:type VI protein secretion system component Hcp
MRLNDELKHFGVKGMKWGIRRYQNRDGTLTEEGKRHREHYIDVNVKDTNKYYDKHIKKYNKQLKKAVKKGDSKSIAEFKRRIKSAEATRKEHIKNIKNMSFDDVITVEGENKAQIAKVAKAVALAAGVAATGGLATAGTIAGVNAAKGVLKGVTLNDVQNTAYKYADMGLRAYTDVRAWAYLTAADQAVYRAEQQDIEGTARRAGNVTARAMNAYSTTTMKQLNSDSKSLIGSGRSAAQTAIYAGSDLASTAMTEYMRYNRGV